MKNPLNFKPDSSTSFKQFACWCLVGLLMVLVLSLAACGGGTPATPVLDANGQPTGQTVQNSGPGVGTGALLGGLAGYMLGRHSATPAAPAYGGGGGGYHPPASNTTIIQKKTTIINKAPTTITKPPVPSYGTSRPSFSRPSTPSYSSRPSPSFSRGGRR